MKEARIGNASWPLRPSGAERSGAKSNLVLPTTLRIPRRCHLKRDVWTKVQTMD